jgi:hypothetical protein
MMPRIVAVVCGLGLAVAAGSVRAQLRTYVPPGGSTLPAQLEYLRPQSGVLDQYNQFVAPRENLNNSLRALANQQNADFQSVQDRIKQSDLIRESEAAPTGTAGGFMNYSHYYGKSGTAGGGRRTVANPRRYTSASPGVGTGMGLPGGIGTGIGAGGGIGIGGGGIY